MVTLEYAHIVHTFDNSNAWQWQSDGRIRAQEGKLQY